jgi:predicted AlkP superfamily phosphohydrolase/phosphomutase
VRPPVPEVPAKVVVLGLDSVPPAFLFERYLPKMPHLREFLRRAQYGTLRTIDPPITVPAWAVMFSGVDPGTLGVYGFRHRRPGAYHDTYTPTPQMLPVPTLWETLSRAGRRVAVVGMPPGYPPPAVNGVYVGDFLTPPKAANGTYPPSLRPELDSAGGGPYRFDVTYRTEDRARIATELFEMTRRRWAFARHLYAKERWDLFVLHEIGPDRLHHAFWKFFDPAHPRHEEHPVFSRLADEYYALLDAEIGGFLAAVDPSATVLLVSDHGSMAMDGCFCINEWLRDRGYLTVRGPVPPPGTTLEKLDVDWSRTRVWGAGGYYARLFFNVRGRDPEGIVADSELPALRAELTRDLEQVRLPDGSPLRPQVFAPKEAYRSVRGDPPDLMAYFGDLKWRSAGTMGYGRWFLEENDTGPDDSVHSFEGFYAIAGPGLSARGASEEHSILEVAPTLTARLGLPPNPHHQARAIPAWL